MYLLKSIGPFTYHGTLQVPYSKSYLQRAIAIALLSRSFVVVKGYTPSKDAIAATEIAKALGAKCTIEDSNLLIDATSLPLLSSVTIHCGEAGLSTRMFSPIAASLCKDVTVIGEGSILVRPMDMVIDALEKLGADVTANEGKLPLRIKSGISAGKLETDGSESSQLLTGLLITLAFADAKSTIQVQNIKSIPYVQMTLDILKDFGATVTHKNYTTFEINPQNNHKVAPGFLYQVEGDWSGASFHIVGAAINGEVELKGLNPNSAQADKEIIKAVELAGATVTWKNQLLQIRSNTLTSFEFDATHCPDLFPPLAALASFCNGITKIKGISRLAAKESDRAHTIQTELAKLGVRVDLKDDLMLIYGGEVLGGSVDSHNDHRIAMMGAVLATGSKKMINISNSEAVKKSYPDFFSDLESVSKNNLV